MHRSGRVVGFLRRVSSEVNWVPEPSGGHVLSHGRTNHPFVESSENSLGIGKLIATDGETATVEYFRSPVEENRIRGEVATRSLARKELFPETRAYFRNSETDITEIGRVLAYQRSDELYLVRFPNNQPRILSSDQFEVYCSLPIEEPTDHLASQVNETAFWHGARSSFVSHVLEHHGTSDEPNFRMASYRLATKDRSVAVRSVLGTLENSIKLNRREYPHCARTVTATIAAIV